MDARTIRAAIAAFALAFGGFAGIGVFLGFEAVPSTLVGLVLGGLCGLMILAVAKRADGMTSTPPTSKGGPDADDQTGAP